MTPIPAATGLPLPRPLSTAVERGDAMFMKAMAELLLTYSFRM
jgi:hypothetical protein